ncbi:EAL domain-containing response regulator [uncultured Pseudoalteromonas sp.]|uniref:EAL domain-containing response regulator n=1 Tax=unclassified Pseudoalteromonas TaxID=194690 RepID=UPI0030D8BD4F|tara:strand:+ start:12133 stop:13362 length:1230 start_codon:yes stop_codon:yes gene_type:complete
MKVLIVDDHAFQRRAITSMISKLSSSYEVCHASDGNEAISFMVTLVPDIIICDLAMPNMDGLALLGQLALREYKGSIILSSVADFSLLRAAANLVDAYGLNLLGIMPKPSSAQQLSYFFQQHQNHIKLGKSNTPALELELDTSKAGLQDAFNKGQFISVFQPQISFANGQCVGLETLCRWQHPAHGLLAPYYFLEYIEQAGLMTELTLAMIEQSINTVEKLPSTFSHAKLAINLSPASLSNELINTILANPTLQALARNQRISFEVTEQTQLLSTNLSLELLSRLRMHGFNLSVDDFGTGYSSLQQLSRYPFNEIKLDRSFVVQAENDAQCAAIADMAIQLARRLKMRVTAEGVETYEQWQYMKRLGADICQGYFCAKPMLQQQLAAWHTQWQQQYQHLKKAKEQEALN